MHVPTPHMPFMHAAAAFGAAQRMSQPPQCATLETVSTQAPAQHAPESGQGRSAVQPTTQVLPTQSIPAPQCSLVRHSTHARVAGLQRRASWVAPPASTPASPKRATQAASSRHPRRHVLPSGSQKAFAGHRSREGRHGRQRPDLRSQTGPPLLPTQSMSPRQLKGASALSRTAVSSLTSGASVASGSLTATSTTSLGAATSFVGPPITELPRHAGSTRSVSKRATRGNTAEAKFFTSTLPECGCAATAIDRHDDCCGVARLLKKLSPGSSGYGPRGAADLPVAEASLINPATVCRRGRISLGRFKRGVIWHRAASTHARHRPLRARPGCRPSSASATL